jgi:hypothetical protein
MLKINERQRIMEHHGELTDNLWGLGLIVNLGCDGNLVRKPPSSNGVSRNKKA